jgi:putative endonuclease
MASLHVHESSVTMKFYYVYILRNKRKNFLYIGYSENLVQRVKDHNNGRSKSTKGYLPLELIHYESYRDQRDAKRRERYLKTNRGRKTIMVMLQNHLS